MQLRSQSGVLSSHRPRGIIAIAEVQQQHLLPPALLTSHEYKQQMETIEIGCLFCWCAPSEMFWPGPIILIMTSCPGCSTFLGNVTNYHQLSLISTQPIVTPPTLPISPAAVSRKLTRIFSHISCFYRNYAATKYAQGGAKELRQQFSILFTKL